jgi:hypothetical protein
VDRPPFPATNDAYCEQLPPPDAGFTDVTRSVFMPALEAAAPAADPAVLEPVAPLPVALPVDVLPVAPGDVLPADEPEPMSLTMPVTSTRCPTYLSRSSPPLRRYDVPAVRLLAEPLVPVAAPLLAPAPEVADPPAMLPDTLVRMKPPARCPCAAAPAAAPPVLPAPVLPAPVLGEPAI